jgi:hypothetical protein
VWTSVSAVLWIYLPCKWNQASSENTIRWGSISILWTDCTNHLQKYTLLAGSHGCNSYSSFWWFWNPSLLCMMSERMFKPTTYSIHFLFSKHSTFQFSCFVQ